MATGVVGATSKLGGLVVDGLRARGHEVVALVRSPAKVQAGGIAVRRCDLVRPETLDPALDGLEVVVSVAGASLMPWPVQPRQTFQAVDAQGHAALAEAAAHQGVRRVVYVSVFGDAAMEPLAYVQAHRDAEEALISAVPEVVVVRPTGLFGAFDQLVPLARRGVAVNAGGGTAKTNPVAEEDVAAVLVDAADGGIPPGVVEVGGPEVLTRSQIWDLALAAHGRAGLRLPGSAMGIRAAAAAMRLVDRRAADVLQFVAHILTHDGVAPRVGTRTLGEHWGI